MGAAKRGAGVPYLVPEGGVYAHGAGGSCNVGPRSAQYGLFFSSEQKSVERSEWLLLRLGSERIHKLPCQIRVACVEQVEYHAPHRLAHVVDGAIIHGLLCRAQLLVPRRLRRRGLLHLVERNVIRRRRWHRPQSARSPPPKASTQNMWASTQTSNLRCSNSIFDPLDRAQSAPCRHRHRSIAPAAAPSAPARRGSATCSSALRR